MRTTISLLAPRNAKQRNQMSLNAVDSRMDTETRCSTCSSYRYNDTRNKGIWIEDKWFCSIHNGGPSLTDRTRLILKYHDDGQLVNKSEYANLLKEWVGD